MTDQPQLFDLPEPYSQLKYVAPPDRSNIYPENPCIALYGPGPEGKQCKDCVHLHSFKQSATWHKCELRQWKSKRGKYPGGDHRVRWRACAKFEERSRSTMGGDSEQSQECP